jgi:hypothetical protein
MLFPFPDLKRNIYWLLLHWIPSLAMLGLVVWGATLIARALCTQT